MSIIAHLRQVSLKQLKQFDKDPSAAYSLILGNSLSGARNIRQEVQDWKTKNALILLKVINAGKVENLIPQDRLLFEKAHLEFGNISRKSVLHAIPSLPGAPRKEPALSLEKSWHGIHYVLTGAPEGGRPPLSWAVLGDKEIPDKEKLMGYGPARVLTAHQVSSVSKAIARFTKEKFRRRFDLEAMKAAKIYGVKSAEDMDYLWAYFQKIKVFYSQAAKQRNGLLSYID
jgi:hypothetical protein